MGASITTAYAYHSMLSWEESAGLYVTEHSSVCKDEYRKTTQCAAVPSRLFIK